MLTPPGTDLANDQIRWCGLLETQRRVFATLYAAPRPGGFLVLCKTETVAAEAKGRCIAVDVKERIYRKPLDSPFFHAGGCAI